jgi:hypothetical protein
MQKPQATSRHLGHPDLPRSVNHAEPIDHPIPVEFGLFSVFKPVL